MPFSRTEEGKIYQRAFGGMTSHYGKGIAQRTAAAADRTGHAILHTLYGQCVKHEVNFFIEYFALDLIIDEGAVRGVMAWNLDDGSIHRFRAQRVIIATGGYGRVYFSCTGAHTQTVMATAWCCAPDCPCRIWNLFSSIRQVSMASAYSITEGVRGEGGYLTNSEGERFMERYAAARQGSRITRRREPRNDHRNPRGAWARPKEGLHPFASFSPRSEDHSRAASGHR